MKKAYIYFAAPFVGLIIFGALYWDFSSDYEQVEADKLAKVKKGKPTDKIWICPWKIAISVLWQFFFIKQTQVLPDCFTADYCFVWSIGL